jgi:antitoxin (DNA-binding transcriptional repressor) of toxin-antitoxin stability system
VRYRVVMAITASKLRENVYRILDEVLETGEPVEIERKGRRLRLVPVEEPRRRRVKDLTPHPDAVIGDPGDLVDISWEHTWKPDP